MQIDPKLRGLQTSFISPSHYKFIYFWQNCKLSRKIIPESPYTLSYIFNKDTVFEKYLRPFEIRTVRNLHFFYPKIQLWFPENIVDFFLGKKLVKMLGFCQNWFFGQKFDFSNSVNYKPFEVIIHEGFLNTVHCHVQRVH